jgi:hypothetical protein
VSLWYGVFAGRIVFRALLRANRSLAGDAALELAPDFVRASLFERVRTSAGEKRACAKNRQGLHLFILGSDGFIASGCSGACIKRRN